MEFLTKKNLEVLIIDGLTVLGVYFLGEINLPNSIYGLISLLAILYAMANIETPNNILLQIFFAFGLFGVVCTISGLLFLLFDNSFAAAIIGMILAFTLVMSKNSADGNISQTLKKLYDHPTRIFIMPIVFNIFILGAESIFMYQISPMFAVIFMFFTYLPVRLLILVKAPFKWYHFFIMATAAYLYTSSMFNKIYNSPTTPVWIGIRNELGDHVKIIENDTIDGIFIEAYLAQSRAYDVSEGTYYFIVDMDSTNHWVIQWDQTDSLNKKTSLYGYEKYKTLKSSAIRNLGYHYNRNN